MNKHENLLQQYTRLYYALHKHNSRAQTIKTKKGTMTKVFENDRCCKDTTYIGFVCFACFQIFFEIFWNGQAILRGDGHLSVNQFLHVCQVLSVSSIIKFPARASIRTEPVRLLADIRSTAASRLLSMLQQL